MNTDDDLDNIDFLEVDQPIPGQNYVCLSFLSPEKFIKQKERFFTLKFLQNLFNDEREKDKLLSLEELSYENVDSLFKDFLVNNEKKCSEEFDDIVELKTSMRTVKVRGVYESLPEAKIRAKILQRKDPKFHVFIGQVGYWLPWDPENLEGVDQMFQEEQMQKIHEQYQINQQNKDIFFQEQKQKRVEAAIKKAAEEKKKQIEEGKLDPSKVPNISQEQINKDLTEFRKDLEAKDRIYDNLTPEEKQAAIQRMMERRMEEEEKEKRRMLEEQKQQQLESGQQVSQKQLDEKREDLTLDESLSTTGGVHADPWMKRKMEGAEEFKPGDDKSEVIDHSGNLGDNLGSKKKDNNMKKVMKNLF